MAENKNDDELSKIFDETLTLRLESPPSTSPVNDEGDDGDDGEEEDGEESEEFEFSFLGGNLSSPVSAEEVFKDGQIRIVSPFSGDEGEASSTTAYDPKVKKVFVVKNDESAAALSAEEGGAFCVWKAPVPEMSQKSNSTGFSKLWKVRDLLARSNSDGKDAFVFLTGKNDETTALKKKKKEVVVTAANGGERKEEKKKEKKEKMKKSAFEELYGGGSDKKKSSGKSYLPYKQDLVGFFTSGSSLSRNVHPY